jgi:hypothetical protein
VALLITGSIHNDESLNSNFIVLYPHGQSKDSDQESSIGVP